MFGPGGISIWNLLIILLIVVMIFGTKKLRSLGGDLGGAVRSFRNAAGEDGLLDGEKKDENSVSEQIGDKPRVAADADFEPAEKRGSDAANR